jgi:hypothetical protein
LQLFVRPPPPGGVKKFNKEVKLFRDRVKEIFAAKKAGKTSGKGNELAVANVNVESAKGKKKTEDPFSPKWSDYKSIFAEAQSGKCGYCEMMVTGSQPGDVEHYWPKGEVWQLKDDPKEGGLERRWASTVEGRKRDVVSERGYWWLAYDWSNYLLSCAVCNQYWKLSYFPVLESPRQLPPNAEKPEVPLLLNPYDVSRNPAEHLRFDDLGQIEAKDKSSCGFETIRTCGLDRESLRRSRSEKARRAYKLAHDLNNTNDQLEITEILKDFYELGRDEYVHSGMVRGIFEDLGGLSWKKLKKLVAM